MSLLPSRFRRSQGSQEMHLGGSVMGPPEVVAGGGDGAGASGDPRPPPPDAFPPMSLLKATNYGGGGGSGSLDQGNGLASRTFSFLSGSNMAWTSSGQGLGSIWGGGSTTHGGFGGLSIPSISNEHHPGAPPRRSERVASRCGSMDEAPELQRQFTSELGMFDAANANTGILSHLKGSSGATPRTEGGLPGWSPREAAAWPVGVPLPLQTSSTTPHSATAVAPPSGAAEDRGGMAGRKREADSSAEPVAGRGKPRTEGSGAHVKSRPEMQKRARDGQEHWLEQVKRLRKSWEAHAGCRDNARFREQVDRCAQLQIKSQHECLLRTLQVASADGLIEPHPFASPSGGDSFLGWTGFQVRPAHAAQFKGRVTGLFPEPLKENTLHTSFRRAGLVACPAKWKQAWEGIVPFRYSQEKREAYAPTRSGETKGRRR